MADENEANVSETSPTATNNDANEVEEQVEEPSIVEVETQLIPNMEEETQAVSPIFEAETQLIPTNNDDDDESEADANNKEEDPTRSPVKGRLKRAIDSDSDDDDNNDDAPPLKKAAPAVSKRNQFDSDSDSDNEEPEKPEETSKKRTMPITLKTITDSSSHEVMVDPSETIGALKAIIEKRDGIASKDLVFFYAGKELEDDKSFIEYDIKKASAIVFAKKSNAEASDSNKKSKRTITDESDDDDDELKMAEDKDGSDANENENDSDDDNVDKEEMDKKKKFAAVFGSSSEDSDDDMGFEEEPPEPVKKEKKKKKSKSSEGKQRKRATEDPTPEEEVELTEFEKQMEKRKKAMKRKRRKVEDGEEDLTESERTHQVVRRLKDSMRNAWEEDDRQIRTQMKRDFRGQKQPATRKLELLPYVMNELRTSSYIEAMQDNNIFEELRMWLSPNRDGSLPNYKIRQHLLLILDTNDFKEVEMELIKSSKLGKVMTWLSQHENETKENKRRLRSIMMNWSRQIFGLYEDTSHVESERVRHSNAISAHVARVRSGGNNTVEEPVEEKKLKPGEAGFIIRARVPRATTKDYAVRPTSNIEMEKTDLDRLSKSRKIYEKKAAGKIDLMTRQYQNKSIGSSKMKLHANSINLSGNLSGFKPK